MSPENTGLPGGLAARLRQVRAAFDLTQEQIARAIGGYRTDTWSRFERGDAAGISLDMLLDLSAWASKQGISLDWLWAGVGSMTTSDQVSKGVVAASRALQAAVEARKFAGRIEKLVRAGTSEKPGRTSPPGRGRAPRGRPFIARRVIEPGYEICQVEALPDEWQGEWVPVLGRIAAGAGIDTLAAESQPAGLADRFVRWQWACEHPFAVEVVGDSMEPNYRERDVVIFDGDRPATEGVSCVIFDEKGERLVRLKRVHLGRGKIRLESLNPRYPPTDLPPEKFIAAYEIAAHLPFLIESKEETENDPC